MSRLRNQPSKCKHKQRVAIPIDSTVEVGTESKENRMSKIPPFREYHKCLSPATLRAASAYSRFLIDHAFRSEEA